MIKPRDTWFRIIVIILPILLSMYINGFFGSPTPVKIGRGVSSIFFIIIGCEGARFIIYNSRRWTTRRKRLWLALGGGVGWIALTLIVNTVVRHFIGTGLIYFDSQLDTGIVINNKQLILNIWGYGILMALIYFPPLLVAYDLIYHYARLRHTEGEKEQLEKQKLRAELQQLKGIVNPHFLFNNLNSLSSLIAENPKEAQDFLDELTRVFRYLLRNNDTELTTLEQELDFITSYHHLLQTRYGTGIRLEKEIESRYYKLRIPPLTLQLLVENAVKHNRINKEQPLTIELYAVPGNQLVIRNNIITKESAVESTGIGLQHINTRYRMLNRPQIKIEKDLEWFSVTIPLLEEA